MICSRYACHPTAPAVPRRPTSLIAISCAVFFASHVHAQQRGPTQLTIDALRADQPRAELPPPRTNYWGRTIALTMSYQGAPWLTRNSREREEDSSRMLQSLRVQVGQTVCDLGCGNGYHTLRLGSLVGPRGKVLAVDIQLEMLELLAERAKARGMHNINPIQGTPIDPRLPAGAIDLLLMVDVYHEFAYPERMLQAIRRSLQPQGRMVLVEFREEDPDVPIKPLHKMSQAQIMKEITANGFKLVEQFDALPWQHVMFFARDDSPLPAKELVPWENPPADDPRAPHQPAETAPAKPR